MQSGTACAYDAGSGTTFPYSATIPIVLQPDGDGYRGTFTVDRFQPGRCGWHFGGVKYFVKGEDDHGSTLAIYDDRPVQVADFHLDVWCVKSSKVPSSSPTEACSNLGLLRGFFSPDFVLSIPAGERGDAPATIGDQAKSLSVRFHDIDAMPNYRPLKAR
jgi:hypothetical protein